MTDKLVCEVIVDVEADENNFKRGEDFNESTFAPAGMTVVVDLRLPYVQSRGGVIMANANGVATGVFASNSALNGCLATAPSATIFGTGAETGTDAWGGCTYEPLWRASKQRVAVTWDAQGRVRYYANGQMICPQDPTVSDVAACPTSTMTFLSGIGAYATRLEVYDGALTPFEVASLGGIEFEPPPPGVLIMVR